MLEYAADSTDQSVDIFIPDPASTNGLDGKSGLLAAGLACYYRRGHTGNLVQVTLSDLAAVTTAHTDGGVKELSPTNMKGMYRVDLPDALFASGVSYATVYVRDTANNVAVSQNIHLVDEVALSDITDYFDVTARTEPAAVPPSNASALDKLDWVFMLSRNKLTQNSTTQTVFADDGSTTVATSTKTSGAGTTTRGEFA